LKGRRDSQKKSKRKEWRRTKRTNRGEESSLAVRNYGNSFPVSGKLGEKLGGEEILTN